jgi:hypothetical protein
VNRRNLVPETVWKHVRRKREDSRTSIPVREERWTGGFEEVRIVEGVRERVIA